MRKYNHTFSKMFVTKKRQEVRVKYKPFAIFNSKTCRTYKYLTQKESVLYCKPHINSSGFIYKYKCKVQIVVFTVDNNII